VAGESVRRLTHRVANSRGTPIRLILAGCLSCVDKGDGQEKWLAAVFAKSTERRPIGIQDYPPCRADLV